VKRVIKQSARDKRVDRAGSDGQRRATIIIIIASDDGDGDD